MKAIRSDDLAGLRHEHLLYFARRCYEQAHAIQPRRYGVSSDAMVEYALGLNPEPSEARYPVDQSDLAACELAYKTAPSDLKPVMLPVLRKYQARLAEVRHG